MQKTVRYEKIRMDGCYMIVETFTPGTVTEEQHQKLIKLCEDAFYLQEPAYANYDVSDWQNKPHTLLNLLYFKKRFGIFNIVSTDDNVPIAMSGAYVYNDVPIIGVRAFTHPDYRGGGHWCQARNIFPKQIDWAESQGYNRVWLTFNTYNSRLVTFLKRMSEGKASTFGGPREIYKNLKWYEEPIEVQYTNQIVAELDIASYRATQSL
jgi:GNAT superfamily N-acetyltransferase